MGPDCCVQLDSLRNVYSVKKLQSFTRHNTVPKIRLGHAGDPLRRVALSAVRTRSTKWAGRSVREWVMNVLPAFSRTVVELGLTIP